jgi:hypothetical protein
VRCRAYLLDADQRPARLAAAAGVGAGEPASPLVIDLTSAADGAATWPLAGVLRIEQPQVAESLPGRFARVPAEPWSDPPERALVLPRPATTPHRPAGLLVLGLSARLALDDP